MVSTGDWAMTKLRKLTDKIPFISHTLNECASTDNQFVVCCFFPSPSGCISAGPHYNPHNKTHGGPTDEERLVKRLTNVNLCNNELSFCLVDDLLPV